MAMLNNKASLTRELLPLAEDINKKQNVLAIEPSTFCEATKLMLDQMYVDNLSRSTLWEIQECENHLLQKMAWRRVSKLPLAPDFHKDKTSLLSQMQSVLSAMNSKGNQIAYVLVHRNGENNLYIGACDARQNELAVEKLADHFIHFTKGAELRPLDKFPYPAEVQQFSFAGAMTGIPALKGEGSELVLQTMDKMANGVRIRGLSRDFALVIRADAASGQDIDALERMLQELENELTSLASWEETIADPSTTTTVPQKNKTYEAAKKATILGTAGSAAIGILSLALNFVAPGAGSVLSALSAIGGLTTQATSVAQAMMFATRGDGISETHNPGSHSVTRHYVNARCKDALELIGKHKQRVKDGKGLGFWNVGVYVLANDTDTVDAVLSTLRGAYAGKETYLSPIRTYNEGLRNGVLCSYARNLELMPLPGRQCSGFGPLYTCFATPLTTPELSIECNPPRESHPGLEVASGAVTYNPNPPKKDMHTICLGEVINGGHPTGKKFYLDVNELVQHASINGKPGSGKTYTVRMILASLHNMNIPFLVIDPVKTDYLDWAISYNLQLDVNDPDYDKKRIHIYMPGETMYDYWDMKTRQMHRIELDQFGINAFQPAVWGAPKTIQLEEHVGKLVELLSGSMGMGNSLPDLLRETITAYLEENFGVGAVTNDMPLHIFWHPEVQLNIADLNARLEKVINEKSYEQEIKGNLRQCVKNCLDAVQKGWKAVMLADSMTWGMEEIFDHPAVVCLKGLGDEKDKAFAMSILMTWMRYYRESRFSNDFDYRAAVANKNVLKHLAVIEEAHVVMSKPAASLSTEDVNPGKKGAQLASAMLREMRSYGQGMLVVDQTVSNLIDEVLNSTNVTLVHSVKADEEAKKIADSIALNPEQKDHLHLLETGHLIVKDGKHQPCWVRVEFRDLQ